MEQVIYFVIGLVFYSIITYIAVKEPKGILIGLIEFAVLLVIVGLVYLVGRFGFQKEGYQTFYALIGLLIGVILKAWLKPAYRLKDGFLYRDRVYRQTDFPLAQFDGDTVYLFTQKQAKKPKRIEGFPIDLTGPLKQRNRHLIESIYPVH